MCGLGTQSTSAQSLHLDVAVDDPFQPPVENGRRIRRRSWPCKILFAPRLIITNRNPNDLQLLSFLMQGKLKLQKLVLKIQASLFHLKALRSSLLRLSYQSPLTVLISGTHNFDIIIGSFSQLCKDSTTCPRRERFIQIATHFTICIYSPGVTSWPIQNILADLFFPPFIQRSFACFPSCRGWLKGRRILWKVYQLWGESGSVSDLSHDLRKICSACFNIVWNRCNDKTEQKIRRSRAGPGKACMKTSPPKYCACKP